MLRRGPSLIVGASLLLLMSVVLAASGAPPLLNAGPRHDSIVATFKPPKAPKVPAPPHLFVPQAAEVGVAVLLLAYLAFILFTVLIGARGDDPRDEPEAVDEDDDLLAPDWAARLRAELETGARQGLDELDSGSPRNAVVACWMRLLDATQRVGLNPDPAETSHEYAARIMRLLRIDQEPVVSLGALYREARFSAHPVTEGQRLEAKRALMAIALDLQRLTDVDPATTGWPGQTARPTEASLAARSGSSSPARS